MDSAVCAGIGLGHFVKPAQHAQATWQAKQNSRCHVKTGKAPNAAAFARTWRCLWLPSEAGSSLPQKARPAPLRLGRRRAQTCGLPTKCLRSRQRQPLAADPRLGGTDEISVL